MSGEHPELYHVFAPNSMAQVEFGLPILCRLKSHILLRAPEAESPPDPEVPAVMTRAKAMLRKNGFTLVENHDKSVFSL